MPDQFTPPDHLSPRAKTLWASVVPSRARSAARLAMVQTALEALDRADAAMAEIGRVGMTSETKTTGAIHVHPLVKVERESRGQFAKLWGLMGLQFCKLEDGVTFDQWQRRERGEKSDLEKLLER